MLVTWIALLDFPHGKLIICIHPLMGSNLEVTNQEKELDGLEG